MLSIEVRKSFGRFSLDVSLTLERGVTVLLGPSGSGKSTVLKLVAGLVEPDSGEIVLDDLVYYRSKDRGKATVLPVHRRRVGYVFQHPALFPHLTVRENILYGVPRGDDRRQDLPELIELLQLGGLEDRLPRQLSGGQAQRVALARALITRPGLLLLDEPFSALDVLTRQKSRQYLRRVLNHRPIPTVFVTHDLEEAMMLGDRVVVMDGGKVLQHGPPREVFLRPKSHKVARFVGMRNIYRGVVRRITPDGLLDIQGEKFDVQVEGRPVRVGARVIFGIRPEDVLYLRPERTRQPRGNVLEATIASVLSQGFMYRLFLRVTDDLYDLEMLLPRHVVEKRRLKPGDLCRVCLPQSAVHLISVEEGA